MHLCFNVIDPVFCCHLLHLLLFMIILLGFERTVFRLRSNLSPFELLKSNCPAVRTNLHLDRPSACLHLSWLPPASLL